MSMRIFSGITFLIVASASLAACEDEAPPAPPMRQANDLSVVCAVDGSTKLEPVCKVEPGPGGYITIRHPKGGFRRLKVYEGHVSTADGSEEATMKEVEGQTIVTVGSDRYALQGSGSSSTP